LRTLRRLHTSASTQISERERTHSDLTKGQPHRRSIKAHRLSAILITTLSGHGRYERRNKEVHNLSKSQIPQIRLQSGISCASSNGCILSWQEPDDFPSWFCSVSKVAQSLLSSRARYTLTVCFFCNGWSLVDLSIVIPSTCFLRVPRIEWRRSKCTLPAYGILHKLIRRRKHALFILAGSYLGSS